MCQLLVFLFDGSLINWLFLLIAKGMCSASSWKDIKQRRDIIKRRNKLSFKDRFKPRVKTKAELIVQPKQDKTDVVFQRKTNQLFPTFTVDKKISNGFHL